MAIYGNCSSGRSGQSNHQPVEFRISQFEILVKDQQTDILHFSPFLMPFMEKLPEPLKWSCESMICSHVVNVLQCITAEVDLKPELNFSSELGLFEIDHGDIWIVTMLGTPIGVVEVKKPFNPESPRSVMDDKIALGQLFDYMMHLRSYTGRQHPFGIITTYHEWRFAWLPDSENIALSTNISLLDLENVSSERNYQLLKDKPIPNISVDLEKPQPSTEHAEATQPTSTDRCLHVSEVYQYSNAKLPYLLLSLFKKMMSSPLIPPSIELSSNQNYIYVSHTFETWHWMKPTNAIPLQFDGKVPASVQAAYLFLDLGGGGDGRVWLGATPSHGKVCVFKFYGKNEKLAMKEKEMWKEIWNIDVKIVDFMEQSVLVMPWLKPCTEDEVIREKEVKAVVKEAVEQFAMLGYKHDDLHLRHVGLYREEENLKALLFDLARTSKIDELSDSTSAVTDMLKDLHIS